MQINEITAVIYGVVLATILISVLVILVIYQIKLDRKQKKYIKTLNDHDKAVILNYITIKGFEKEEKQ